MAWLIVLAAGLFETGFAVLLKQSHGLTNLWPTAGFAACALISFGLLTVALRELEVGAAYAVWTGIGAAGTAIIGMIFLGTLVRSSGEKLDWPRYAVGVAGPDFDGDVDDAPLWAGESCTVVNNGKPAAQIVSDLVAEAETALAQSTEPAS